MTDNRSSGKRLEIELRLPSVAALFHPSESSPMSPDFHPYSYTSGLEYIADRLSADRRIRAVDATLAMPSAALAATSHDQVRAGIRRYADARIEALDVEVRADSTIGRRALIVGLGAAVVMLIIAAWFADLSNEGFTVDTIVLGLEIGAWVAVWFPLERIFWTAWSHRRMRRDYEVLRELEFTLVAEEGASVGTTPT